MELGLSQEELARLMGVARVVVWRWERGSLDPTERQNELLEAIERAVRRDPALTKCVQMLLVREGAVLALFHILRRASD